VLAAEKRKDQKPESTRRSDRVETQRHGSGRKGGGGCAPQPPPKASAAQRTATDCPRVPGADGNRRRRASQIQTPGADSSFLPPSPPLIRCTAHRRNGYEAARHCECALCVEGCPLRTGRCPPQHKRAQRGALHLAARDFGARREGDFVVHTAMCEGVGRARPPQVRPVVTPPDYKQIGRARAA